MGNIGEQCAERHDELTAGLGGDAADVVTEAAPLKVGFRPDHDDKVVLTRRDRRGKAVSRRPRDAAHDAIDQLDLGTVGLEVEVGLGVEPREPVSVEVRDQPLRGCRRRVGCVVPPFERGDEHRTSQPRVVVPDEAGHHVTLTLRARCDATPAQWVARRTVLRSVPACSTVTSTTSPSSSHRGGVRLMPTPAGVPVEITSPASSVTPCER